MKKRFSIWGREYDSAHDVEIIQVETNPQAILDGLVGKTLTIDNGKAKKKSKVRKYSWLRIVENGDGKA